MFDEKEFDIPALCPKGLKTGIVNLLFLEGEEEGFSASEEYLKSVCAGDSVYLAKYGDYDDFLRNMGFLKGKLNIKNHAALILYLINEKCEEIRGREREEGQEQGR